MYRYFYRALFFILLAQLYDEAKVFSIIVRSDPKCRPIKGPEACEDIEIHHKSGLAFMACGSENGRRTQWWPPLGSVNTTVQPLETPWIYNLETEEIFPLKLKDFPKDTDVSLHGLSLYIDPSNSNKVTVFLINHRRSGSVVEILDHTIGTKELIYRKTVSSELIVTPNDLVAVSADEFYVTNDHRYTYKQEKEREFEIATRRLWTNVIFHAKNGTDFVAAEGISLGNGIVANWNYSRFYVNSGGTTETIIYTRLDNNLLFETERVHIGIPTDNLSVDEVTGEVYTPGFPDLPALIKYLQDPKSPAPDLIVKISNVTKKADSRIGSNYQVTKVLDSDGKEFTAISIAAVDRKRDALLLGSFVSKGITRCKLSALGS
ncbi:12922_t:CDS:2 [Ambispora gerdemannii]|uniref:12922_t:CDS:1 n=1 Tax=Ambispora gerdemannii TaxID=144530 RepID=A0A9N9ASN1_9GLOM|nr:12922_t:CDS:2 [Ambispora gerdemannii]